MSKQCYTGNHHGAHNKNRREKHPDVYFFYPVFRPDFREETGKPKEHKACIGGTGEEGISIADLRNFVQIIIYRFNILRDICCTVKNTDNRYNQNE